MGGSVEKRMDDVDRLTEILKARFSQVPIRPNYGWPGRPALSVLDCVLSLNRPYKRVVYPRVVGFSERRPEIVELPQLQSLLDQFDAPGRFCRDELNYNDARREQTLRGVVRRLLEVQAEQEGATEQERLQRWAASVGPGDHARIGVKGFGLSGFQYLRMLFGVQTAKPDVHIVRFVSQSVGRRVNDRAALTLLEQAAEKAGLPLREVDGAIWKAGARPR